VLSIVTDEQGACRGIVAQDLQTMNIEAHPSDVVVLATERGRRVVALDRIAVLLAGGFGVGVLKRDELDVGRLRLARDGRQLDGFDLVFRERGDHLRHEAAGGQSAGTQHIKDLAKIGSSAGSRNSHRDLLRKLAKTSQWPKLYFGGVRVWNRRTQAVEIQHVPVLLPHEVFASIAGQSDIRNFASRAALIESARDHLVAAEQNLGPGAPIVSIGLWIDGTPCNWDRSEGVESFVVSCPGVSGQSSSVRIPFAVMMQKHCVAEATFDDLLTIFVWSLK